MMPAYQCRLQKSKVRRAGSTEAFLYLRTGVISKEYTNLLLYFMFFYLEYEVHDFDIVMHTTFCFYVPATGAEPGHFRTLLSVTAPVTGKTVVIIFYCLGLCGSNHFCKY